MKQSKIILNALLLSVTTSILLSGCITVTTSGDDTSTTPALSSSASLSPSSGITTSSIAGTSSTTQQTGTSSNTQQTGTSNTTQANSSTAQNQNGTSGNSTMSSSQKSSDGTQGTNSIATGVSESNTTQTNGSSQAQVAMSSFTNVIGAPYDFNALTVASLQAANETIDQYDLKYEIDAAPEFYHTYVEESDDEEADKCFTSKIAQNAVILGNGFTQYTAENLDISDCMENFFDDEESMQVTSIKVILSSLWKIKAEDQYGILVPNINNSLLTDYDPIGKGGKAYTSRKIEMYMEFSIVFDEGTLKMAATTKSILGQTSNIDEPCVHDESGNSYTNCSEYTQNTQFVQTTATDLNGTTDTTSSETTYQEFHYKNLKLPKGGTYYTGGTIDFTYNNWSGTMSYGADPETNPTYVVSNGTDEITGTFNNTVSLHKQAVSSTIEAAIRKAQKSLKQ